MNDSVSCINGPTVDHLTVERTGDQAVREMLDLSPGHVALSGKLGHPNLWGFSQPIIVTITITITITGPARLLHDILVAIT